MSSKNSRDLFILPNDKRLEIRAVRQKCSVMQLEKFVKTYDRRLNVSNTAMLMLMDSIIMVTHVLLLVTTVESLDYVRVDIFIYLLTMVLNLVLLMANFNVKLQRKHPNRILAANVTVAFIMVIRDVLVMGYHHLSDNIYTYPCYNHIVIIFIYTCFPFEGLLYPILTASFATFIITANVLTLQLLHKMHVNIVYLTVFHLCLHLMGLSNRISREYFIRCCVLTRCKLVEDQLLLKVVMAREKAMLRTLIPTDFAVSMRQTMQQRSEWTRFDKPMRTLFIQSHSNVSILNADIVNYTSWTSKINVKRLVEILHEIFYRFDYAAEEHNVQPIKFLGDAYICVAGIPLATQIHAKSCVDLGLEMIESLREVCEKFNIDVHVRIGVHSGEVLSGIIGWTKWQYDVWSKDVDIATRLEHFGIPDFVHISEQTFQLLDDQYVCEAGPKEAQEDPILQKYQMTTYSVKGLKNPDEGYPSLGIKDSTRLSIETHKTFADSYKFTRKEVRSIALSRMYEEVENMPIGRIRVARIFDFSNQPDPAKCEDYEFQPKISTWLMFFRKSSDEWSYMNQPDVLLKYQVIVATIVIYAIIFLSAQNTTFQNTYGYFILLGIFTTVVCFIVMYMKLWIIFISTSSWDRPNNTFSLFLYTISEMTQNSLYARIMIYFYFMGAAFAMCCLQMVNCNLKELELQTIDAQLSDNPSPPSCFLSSVYIQSIVLVIMISFTFIDIPLVIKIGAIVIIIISLLATILGEYGFIFERDTHTNPGFHSEYSHCFYVATVVFVFFIRGRKKLYISKMQF